MNERVYEISSVRKTAVFRVAAMPKGNAGGTAREMSAALTMMPTYLHLM